MKIIQMIAFASMALMLGFTRLHAEGALTNETAQMESTKASALKVTLKIGTAIENREVVGEAETIAASSEQLVAWTLVEGAETSTTLTHEWIHNGTAVATVNLDIKSAHYRTYSRITLGNRSGNWKVEVKDANGTVLASKEFKVQ